MHFHFSHGLTTDTTEHDQLKEFRLILALLLPIARYISEVHSHFKKLLYVLLCWLILIHSKLY
jgi:hypothetical protein